MCSALQRRPGGAGWVYPSFRNPRHLEKWLSLGARPQKRMQRNEKRGISRLVSLWSHLAGKTPQDWSPQEDTLRPQGQSLEHVVARPDPTVQVHLQFPFHGSHHFRQGVHLKQSTGGLRLTQSMETAGSQHGRGPGV